MKKLLERILSNLTIENKIMEEQIIKRLKSFAWRLGSFLFVAAVSWVSAHLSDLQLPIWLQTALALVLGEVTKYLNNTNSHK